MSQIRIPSAALAASLLLLACDKGEQAVEGKPAPEAKAKTPAPDAKADAADVVAKADAAKADAAKADAAKPDAAKADAAKADAAKPEADAAAGETPAVAATPAEPGKPGPAFFAVRDKGVVMLDGGTFTTLKGSPDKLVRDIKQGPDGGIYLLGYEGVLRLQGAAFEVVAKTGFGTDTDNLDHVAITKEGEFWGVNYTGISHWDGSAWKNQEKTVLGDDVKLLDGVALDADGRVWVASSNALHVREGEAWTTVDLGKAVRGKPYFQGVGTGAEGIVYAITSDVMIKATAVDSFEKIKIGKRFSMLDRLGFSAAGVIGLRANLDMVTRIGVDGAKTNYKKGKDFKGQIEDVAPDDSGRLWIATDAGIAILGPGDERVEWKSGSIDQLAGKIDVIGVIGSGPELPGEVGPVKTGGLKGKILKGGAAVADTQVEICPNPSGYFTKSPCADSPTRLTATTDAEGSFQIDSVPLGAYGLAVKTGKKWQLTFGAEYGADMKEGEVYDIGAVKLREDEKKK